MYISFLTTNPIKYCLKFIRPCCGLSTVVCGRLAATSKAYILLTGRIADNQKKQLKK
jgi:hypothetical protein